MGHALAVVKRFYEATDRKQLKELEGLVAPDVVFVGPVMQARGAAQYLGMNEQFLPMHVATRMLRQWEEGDHVCSIYEMDLRSPQGGKGLTLHIADWIRVAGGKVAEQRIYYDAREFAKAFGMAG